MPTFLIGLEQVGTGTYIDPADPTVGDPVASWSIDYAQCATMLRCGRFFSTLLDASRHLDAFPSTPRVKETAKSKTEECESTKKYGRADHPVWLLVVLEKHVVLGQAKEQRFDVVLVNDSDSASKGQWLVESIARNELRFFF